jgi:hypothetical protein
MIHGASRISHFVIIVITLTLATAHVLLVPLINLCIAILE